MEKPKLMVQLRIVAILMSVLPTITHAEFMDGTQLYNLLTSTNVADKNVATGYLMAVVDTTELHRHLGSQAFAYCLPPNFKSEQASLVVKKYLESKPERLHESAALLASESLFNAFPCK